jgi:hypothetical protein
VKLIEQHGRGAEFESPIPIPYSISSDALQGLFSPLLDSIELHHGLYELFVAGSSAIEVTEKFLLHLQPGNEGLLLFGVFLDDDIGIQVPGELIEGTLLPIRRVLFKLPYGCIDFIMPRAQNFGKLSALMDEFIASLKPKELLNFWNINFFELFVLIAGWQKVYLDIVRVVGQGRGSGILV